MDKEQAIVILKEISYYHNRNYSSQLYDIECFIEQQEKQMLEKQVKDTLFCSDCQNNYETLLKKQEGFAELGRLAMAINICGLVFTDTCSISCTECSDYEFCKLRTELLVTETL